MKTLAELYRELERHDWFHAMSDDPSVYASGDFAWRLMQAEARKIEGGEALVSAYSKHVFSGKPFGTSKAPKPAKPTETTEPKKSERVS